MKSKDSVLQTIGDKIFDNKSKKIKQNWTRPETLISAFAR